MFESDDQKSDVAWLHAGRGNMYPFQRLGKPLTNYEEVLNKLAEYKACHSFMDQKESKLLIQYSFDNGSWGACFVITVYNTVSGQFEMASGVDCTDAHQGAEDHARILVEAFKSYCDYWNADCGDQRFLYDFPSEIFQNEFTEDLVKHLDVKHRPITKHELARCFAVFYK